MFDWLDLKNEEELEKESQLAVEGNLVCYDKEIYLHQNYKIICQLVINYMSIMDSVYFNDFFQISKILIYAGLHVGFDMSEEIAALKSTVNEASESNDWAVRKLYLMDEALKSLNRYVIKEQEE